MVLRTVSETAEAAARQIHIPQGREVADGLSKAIGLLCLTEFRRTSTEVSHPLSTDHWHPSRSSGPASRATG